MPYISKSLQSCVCCIRKKLWSMLSRSFPELCTITTSDWILIMVLTSWRSQIPQNIKYCLLCLSFMCCAARFGLWPLSFPVRSCAMHCALRCILPPAQPMPKQMVHLGGSRRNPKPKRQRGSAHGKRVFWGKSRRARARQVHVDATKDKRALFRF